MPEAKPEIKKGQIWIAKHDPSVVLEILQKRPKGWQTAKVNGNGRYNHSIKEHTLRRFYTLQEGE